VPSDDQHFSTRFNFELNEKKMNHLPEEICMHFMSYAGIPFTAEIYAHDLNIDWGDGVISSFRNSHYFSLQHEYETEGLYMIHISGLRISGLNVSRLSLTELFLLNCPALEYLNCAVNELEQLDLSACPVLEDLICNSNNLRKMDFSSNPRLLQINASYNLMTKLDVTACACLQCLCCSYNRLVQLRLEGCHLLNSLDCSANVLDRYSLENVFRDLSVKVHKGLICYSENPGSETVDSDLLQSKNWL